MISEKVFTFDPRITVYSISAGAHAQLPDGAWQRPTLTVALISQFKLKVLRGPILTNQPIDKLEQHRIFREADIPTPPTLAFEFGMKLDPNVFGEFVVIKPMSLGLTSGGKGIQLFRRKRLEKIVQEEFPNDHPIHGDKKGYLVQRFIDTGTLGISLLRVATNGGCELEDLGKLVQRQPIKAREKC